MSDSAPTRRPPSLGTEGPLLRVRDLRIALRADPTTEPVAGASFDVGRGEIVGLVGESGSGKTLTALAVLGLLPRPLARVGGSIELAGAGDLTALDEAGWRSVRGRRVAMIFQEPTAALNPVLSLGFQLRESLRLHRGLRGRAATREARELLERVAMPDAERRLDSYPHQLSGGQAQRALLALALAGRPELLLADEPTTALDVTVQSQILALLRSLADDLDLAVLLITHDLGVVAETCRRAAVMYAGRVVETATVASLLRAPAHPYARALLAARSTVGSGASTPIPGRVPSPGARPSGCAFHPRCPDVFAPCEDGVPSAFARPDAGVDDGSVACFLHAPGATAP